LTEITHTPANIDNKLLICATFCNKTIIYKKFQFSSEYIFSYTMYIMDYVVVSAILCMASSFLRRQGWWSNAAVFTPPTPAE